MPVFGKFVSDLKNLIPSGGNAATGKQLLLERRAHTRLLCKLDIECRQSNRDHAAVAVDLCAAGVCVETAVQLDEKQDVFLSYRPGGTPLGRQRLQCRVVWSRRDGDRSFYGLKFTDEQVNIDQSWAHFYMKQVGFNPHQAIKRRARRIRCHMDAVLTSDQEGLVLDVTVVDLGVGGARLLCAEKLDKNVMVTLALNCPPPAGNLRLLSRIVQSRSVGDELQLNLRFLNRSDSPEMVNLGQYLLNLIRQQQNSK